MESHRHRIGSKPDHHGGTDLRRDRSLSKLKMIETTHRFQIHGYRD